MSFEILNHFCHKKYFKVNNEELIALKKGAELMELARVYFDVGPGNQYTCHCKSSGEAYMRWRKARALNKMPLNQATKDYINYFSRHVSQNSKKPPEKAVTDLVVGFAAAHYVGGGNCAENADMMAFLVIANGGLSGHYKRLHRVWLSGAGHEITIVESTNDGNRPILLDTWIPASQSCLLEHSLWKVALELYEPDWTIDIVNENKFGIPFTKGLIKYTESQGQQLVDNDAVIARIESKGESAWVTRQCKNCDKIWGTHCLELDDNGEKRLCPNCKKADLYSIAGQYIYFKPPFHKNIEAKKNLGIHLYGNIGIIHKNIGKAQGSRVVLPYTKKDKPDEGDMNAWSAHHNRLRKYKWGQVE